MIARSVSPARAGRPVRTTLALLTGLALMTGATAGVTATATATELKPPSARSKLLRDNDDVTIIIIDENDRRSKSRVKPPRASKQAPLQPPSSRVSRDEDELNIRIRRDRDNGSSTTERSGPKIIIVDKNSSGCDGGGVCVIRP